MVTILKKLASQAEVALTQADLERIEKQDLRREYSGKTAPKVNRRVLDRAQVVTGATILKREKEEQLRDQQLKEKAQQAAARKAARTTASQACLPSALPPAP